MTNQTTIGQGQLTHPASLFCNRDRIQVESVISSSIPQKQLASDIIIHAAVSPPLSTWASTLTHAFQFQVGITWWLDLDPSRGAPCVRNKVLISLVTCKHGVFRHNKLKKIESETCCWFHVTLQLEVSCNLIIAAHSQWTSLSYQI